MKYDGSKNAFTESVFPSLIQQRINQKDKDAQLPLSDADLKMVFGDITSTKSLAADRRLIFSLNHNKKESKDYFDLKISLIHSFCTFLLVKLLRPTIFRHVFDKPF